MSRTHDLLHRLSRQWTYTHGVLSFALEDAPTEAQQQEAMDAFERLAFAGLDREQWDATWVRHSHTGHRTGSGIEQESRTPGGRVELHMVPPRVDLGSGLALNIAPPGVGVELCAAQGCLELHLGLGTTQRSRRGPASSRGSQRRRTPDRPTRRTATTRANKSQRHLRLRSILTEDLH